MLPIASDVAARGLDIAGLSHVFNVTSYPAPKIMFKQNTRTGRAGKSGRAFTIAASKDDQKRYIGATQKTEWQIHSAVCDVPDNGASVADEKPAARKSRSQSKIRKPQTAPQKMMPPASFQQTRC